MNWLEVLKTAIRSLTGNKLRTLLSLLGIVIGIASVIIMVSIGLGAKQKVADDIAALGSNLINVSPATSRGRGGRLSQDVVNIFTAELLGDLEQIPGVQHVSPMVTVGSLLSYKGINYRASAFGVSPGYEHITNYHPRWGRFITGTDLKFRSEVAVLGSEVAKNLFGPTENPVGKRIKAVINGRPTNLTVVGLMEEKGQVSFSNFDDRIYLPYTTLLDRMLGRDFVNAYVLSAASSERVSEVADRIEFFMLKRIGDSEKFRVLTQESLLSTITNTVQIFTTVLGAIAGISLLVGGIGIMNIMLVSVTERTTEIGVRKALGAKNRDILSQFLAEAMLLSAAGGVIGLAVGWGGGYVLSRFAEWPFVFSWVSVLVAVGFSSLVGLCFGIFPAMRAAKLQPVVALRH
ncbi:MAG: ABC transporter permease [Firmicutes bacterium]|nr:ABC transporter permease [Bacillota bacterium]